MKFAALTLAAVAAISAPAFAGGTQIERSLGLDASEYGVHDAGTLATVKYLVEQGSDSAVVNGRIADVYLGR